MDLAFQFLPELISLARGVSEQDPLVEGLRKLAEKWPLSSVACATCPVISTCLRCGRRFQERPIIPARGTAMPRIRKRSRGSSPALADPGASEEDRVAARDRLGLLAGRVQWVAGAEQRDFLEQDLAAAAWAAADEQPARGHAESAT